MVRRFSLAAVAVVCISGITFAGHGNNNNNGGNRVGGVSINTAGVLAQPVEASLKPYKELQEKRLQKLAPELSAPVELRKISLRQIEAALAQSGHNFANQMPDDIKYLAGIQRLQYIFVYPEQGDIVLAGPGEGWKVNANADIVGITTGRPVLRLDDLLAAFRTVENARQGNITCSIDPTPEGRQQMDAFMARQQRFSSEVLDGIEKALGSQQISITGVPDTSRFARMLVASDYHMKRIAMKLDASPIAGLPSFIDMLKTKGQLDNMMPRWWMACNYEPIAKSPDGLAWEIRGPGVKVMTEDELIGGDGRVKGTGKVNPVAQKWADLMTEKYDELSAKETSFGELRNIMDMCVVAALIAKENLMAKANCEIPIMASPSSKVSLSVWDAPKTVSTQCSALKRGSDYIITASGGVEITSWQVADKTVADPAVGDVRAKAMPAKTQSGSSVWWN